MTLKLRSVSFALGAFVALGFVPPLQGQTVNSQSEQRLPETTKGIELFDSGDTEGAIAKLTSVVKAHPEASEAWHYLGRSYNRLGKNDEAIKAFQQAVKLDPSASASRVGLALAFQRSNKLAEASNTAEAGLKNDPNCDGCHYVLGLVALKKNNQHEAWRHAALALKMNKNSSAARDLRNQALVNTYAQALSVKLKINEEQTQGALLALNLISSSMGIIMDPSMATQDFRTKQGDRFNKVKAFYEEALAEAPDDPDVPEWRERLNALQVWRSIILTEDGLKKNEIIPREEVSTAPVALNKPPYSYPDDFRQAGVKGQVVLGAVVLEDGRTNSIFVLQPLHAVLTQSALTAARQQLFKPAMKDGKPVKTIVTLKYDFGVAGK